MNTCDELNYLTERSNELQAVIANLDGMKKCMIENAADSQTNFYECADLLDEAIKKVHYIKKRIDMNAAALNWKLKPPYPPSASDAPSPSPDAHSASQSSSPSSPSTPLRPPPECLASAHS
jgi:hypothetical protein